MQWNQLEFIHKAPSLLSKLYWYTSNLLHSENKNSLCLLTKSTVHYVLVSEKEEVTWPDSRGKDSLSYWPRFICEKALKIIFFLCKPHCLCFEKHYQKLSFRNWFEIKITKAAKEGVFFYYSHWLLHLAIQNFLIFMIAYFNVMHLVLPLPPFVSLFPR